MGIAKRLLAKTEKRTHRLSPDRAERVLQRLFGSWVGSEPVQGEQATLFDVPAKSTYRRRNKAEIREWLKTDEGQKWLSQKVREKNAAKDAVRQRRDMEEMKRLGSISTRELYSTLGRYTPPPSAPAVLVRNSVLFSRSVAWFSRTSTHSPPPASPAVLLMKRLPLRSTKPWSSA